jgi:T-complex protein 1 subunit theta
VSARAVPAPRQVGDGSNLVVVFCGELLSLAEALIRGGVHPSEIISGYTQAYRKLVEFLPQLVVHTEADVFSAVALQRGIYGAIAAKQYGVEDVLAPLVAEACALVMPKNPANFLVENVRVCKILGQSIHDSQVIKGVLIDRDTEGMIKKAENVRVAVFSCPLDTTDTETKGTVLISNAEELLTYSSSEEAMMETVRAREWLDLECGSRVS